MDLRWPVRFTVRAVPDYGFDTAANSVALERRHALCPASTTVSFWCMMAFIILAHRQDLHGRLPGPRPSAHRDPLLRPLWCPKSEASWAEPVQLNLISSDSEPVLPPDQPGQHAERQAKR